MVAMPRIGRKLTHKRRQRAAQQSAPHLPAPAPRPLPARRAVTDPQWQQTYHAWTQSHEGTLSGLTPDMLRRENLYDEDA